MNFEGAEHRTRTVLGYVCHNFTEHRTGLVIISGGTVTGYSLYSLALHKSKRGVNRLQRVDKCERGRAAGLRAFLGV